MKTTPTDYVHHETKVLKLKDNMYIHEKHTLLHFLLRTITPTNSLTHDRPLNRYKWITPAHYYFNFYNTLPPHPETHHYEHTSTSTSPIEAYIPWNQTPY